MTNAEIKELRSLREKKFRDALSLFLVEGEKMVGEALASDFEVKAVYRKSEIGEAAMAKISQFSSPSPVVAVVRKPSCCVDAEALGDMVGDGLFLALDSVRDPGNMGTIIRLAEWFGVKTVFASPDCVELFNPKVVQATMGAVFRVRVIYTDIPALCRLFRERGLGVFGTFLDGDNIYAETLPSSALVVMGNEANGISGPVAAEVDRRVLIPSFGGSKAESLNVAVATAVTLSEFRRRG